MEGENLAFTDQQFEKLNELQAAQNLNTVFVAEEKKPKLLNGRYKKIVKLGEGSFNVVYLAEDLYPQGKSRMLSDKHKEMVAKLPDSVTNPYKKMSHSYFDDYDEDGNERKQDDDLDPKVKEELQNNQVILPENHIFEGEVKKDETSETKKKRHLVAVKKQKNIMGLDGLEFSLLREIKLLQELNHPNVVKLHDVFHLKNLLFFALEFGAIDLADLILKERDNIILEAPHIKCIMKQILEGLGYLHSNWIMHRDLKPGNMVIDDNGIIKLIDFNSAKIYGSPNRAHSKQTTT